MPRKKLKRFTELAHFELHPPSIQMLSLAFCSRNRVVVLGRVDLSSQEVVHLGMLEPDRDELIQALAVRWARPVVPVQLNQYEINKALDAGFGAGFVDEDEFAHVLDLSTPAAEADASARALVDDMLLHAIAQRASDIHLESYAADVDVRLRIDGVLHQLNTHIDPENLSQVSNRLKIMSSLDITEHRHAQDGRFRALVKDGTRRTAVDFRISVLPGPYGEDMVIRVLDSKATLIGLEKLGMSERDLARFRAVLDNPEGTILVTGPTGSGKTTTLYSALGRLNDGTRKILTAEDPIEYYLPKINQKQVHPTQDMAALARAFLRQDPDVLLIGEIRDRETARVTARAAVTGHLVFSTLHTADSIGSIPRLRLLGLTDQEIADTLLLVVSQRLARRICGSCSEAVEVTEEQCVLLGSLVDGLQPFRGRGCEKCRGTGILGRVGIFELLVVDEKLQAHIADSMPTAELRQHLRSGDGGDGGHGESSQFVPLIDDGLQKVRDGVISLDELLRIVPYRQIIARLS